LKRDGLIDGAVLDPLDLGRAEAPALGVPARRGEVRRAQEASHHVAPIGGHQSLLARHLTRSLFSQILGRMGGPIPEPDKSWRSVVFALVWGSRNVRVLVLIVAAMISGYLLRAYAPQSGAFGTTRGVILVDSPEIFSRERLVNDRFRETAWLQIQLDRTDNLRWGNQARVASQIRSDFKGSVAAPASTAPPGTSRPAGSTPANESQSPPAVGTQGQGVEEVDVSPIDLLRDKMAYRDEVRTAAIETQLDDRHDIAGNTLYRAQFKITIIPEHNTSAWAVVVVAVDKSASPPGRPNGEDIYRDWLEQYEEQLNDDMKRMSASAKASDFAHFDFGSFTDFVQDQISARGVTDSRLAKLVAAEQSSLEKAAQRTWIDSQNCSRLTDPAQRAACQRPPPACEEDGASDPSRCPWGRAHLNLRAVMHVYRDTSAPELRQILRSDTILLNKLLGDYVIQRLNVRVRAAKDQAPMWQRAWVKGCETGSCRIKLDSLASGADALAKALADGYQVFPYAVAPKEAVQRISALAGAKLSQELTVSAPLKTLASPLDTLFSLAKAEDRRLTSILRKPLIVGFSGESEGGRSTDQVASFGWIVGPKFSFDEKNDPQFRHVPVQNEVSAIISVPSWWRWADVRVASCWMDEREVAEAARAPHKFLSFSACEARAASAANNKKYTVRLPGVVTEIARKLGLDVVRRPSLTEGVTPDLVQANWPADLLIVGNHLWRSTVVVLGGQTADEIVVLPNMRGIVARFRCVRQAPTESKSDRPAAQVKALQDFFAPIPDVQVPLSIWTSEGTTSGNLIRVRSSETPHPKCLLEEKPSGRDRAAALPEAKPPAQK
jgi:hypothetical protein